MPELTISPLSIERLRASRFAWKDQETHAAEVKEKWQKAKATRDEREQAMAEAVDQDQADKAVAELAREFNRAERTFERIDRDKRSAEDQAKKMRAKFVELAEALAEGTDDDLYAKSVDTGESWRGTLVADVVGDLQAQQFLKVGLRSVADLLENDKDLDGYFKAGDLDRKPGEFVLQAVARWMEDGGRRSAMTARMRKLLDGPRRAPVEPPKEAKTQPEGEDAPEPAAAGASAE